MNKTDTGTTVSFTISPITNVMEIGGSVLPKRFIGESESQGGPIVGGDLSSTSMPIFQPTMVIIPINIPA